MAFDPRESHHLGAKIKVIGVGGGGTNAVSTMIKESIEGVDFIAANTDIQSLKLSLAGKKIQIGKELTKGLGAGADPDIGRDAALEDRHELHEALAGADMVFVTAGMGGGTGTGGVSIVSQIARDQGSLTVGVVTKPFDFEGKRRRLHAEMGIERLKENVDTLIVIPNQRLLEIASPHLTMVEAFKMADRVLVNAVRGISDIINIPGTVNVDFADVKTIMSSTGRALMGIGSASGENRAVEAAEQAISSPLLEDVDISGATGLLINITASENISLLEINDACTIIQNAAHEDANIIFGAVIDKDLVDEMRVTVIATGFPSEADVQTTHRQTVRSRQNEYSRHTPYFEKKEIRPAKPRIFIPPPAEEKHKEVAFETTKPVDEMQALAYQTLNARYKEEPSLTQNITVEAPDTLAVSLNETQKETKTSLAENFISEESFALTSEINKKIDEALEIASRVKNFTDYDDELDIPTFLRVQNKDNPPVN